MGHGATGASAHDDHGHDHKPGFVARWFFSTNHKDIGTLYIIFSIIAGLIGGLFSVIMRMELQSPGTQLVTDGLATGERPGQLDVDGQWPRRRKSPGHRVGDDERVVQVRTPSQPVSLVELEVEPQRVGQDFHNRMFP